MLQLCLFGASPERDTSDEWEGAYDKVILGLQARVQRSSEGGVSDGQAVLRLCTELAVGGTVIM